ncbi:MAG: glycogen debranching enzyme N-terminal domain-containing protein, partial [Nanoarchaeota archaeon]
MLVFSKKECEEKARTSEWILTNSIGGYSNTTLSCKNTKKEQGLLITELNNKKYLLLSELNEELIIENKIIKPEIESFLFNIYPTINLKHEGIEIIKSVVMPHLHNTVIISYKIYSNKECKIRIKPYVNSRENDKINSELTEYKQAANRNTVVIKPRNIKAAIIIGSDKAEYKEDSAFDGIEYNEEGYYNAKELVYNPGYFEYNIRKGMNKINIICVADHEKKAYETFSNLYSTNERYYENFFNHEISRVRSLIRQTYEYNNLQADYLLPYLIQSTDTFIKRINGTLNIISNYPEGKEDGRDALISLTGLCLTTSKFDDAQKILKYYADNMINGLVPINIKKNGLVENNSVDASLWFIYSVYKYYQYTNNINFIKEHLWEKMRDVIHHYYYGTDHGI